jgi:hypothetical protein
VSLLTMGKVARQLIPLGKELDDLQDGFCLFPHLSEHLSMGPEIVCRLARLDSYPDVFQDRQLGKDVRQLIRDGDPFMRDNVWWQIGNILTLEPDLSPGRMEFARDQLEESTLSSPVRAYDGVNLSSFQSKVHTVNRPQTAEGFDQGFCS